MGQQGLLDGGQRRQLDHAGQLLAGLGVVVLQPTQQVGHAVGERQQHQAGPEQKLVLEGELIAEPDGGREYPFHMKPRAPTGRVAGWLDITPRRVARLGAGWKL